MKKKFITALLSIILILITSSTASAVENQSIKFNIDGYERPEITAQIINQTTFVPLRIINNQFSHLQTVWENDKIVSVTNSKTNEVLKFSLKSNIAYKNGKQIPLSTPAKIINGVTYVPLRFISENMGLFVHWDPPTKYIVIYDVDQERAAALQNTDLAKARNAALSLPKVALHKYFTTDKELLNNITYYFPYGESKRFISYQKDLIFFYEIKNNAAWLVWEGKQDEENKREKSIIPYIVNNVKQEWGARPDFGNKISYFFDYYMADIVRYGTLENGVINEIGEIITGSGADKTIAYNIPGETKID